MTHTTPTDTIRVVVDTNLWISFLIGRRLATMLDLLEHPLIEVITTPLLVEEVSLVAHREKFRKYFSVAEADELVRWFANTTSVQLEHIPARCRDPKDDYLLELAVEAKAIYLVSGDEDLLNLKQIEGCRIMTVAQFVAELDDLVREQHED